MSTGPVRAAAVPDPSRLRPLAAMARAVWFLEDDLAALPRLVPAGATCLDIGANRGTYMVTLALLAGSEGRVVAAEPLTGPLRTARALRRVLRLDNVELHQLAVGEAHRELTLVVPYRYGLPVYGRAFLGDAPELSPDDLAGFTAVRRHAVRVTTVDALADELDLRRLDFVKCDIEGAELRMLAGAEQTLARHRPVVLLEIEDRHVRKYGHTADDVRAWLSARDYRAHILSGTDLVPVEGIRDGVRNYFFLPR
jgi:FkbM family methyltransferase